MNRLVMTVGLALAAAALGGCTAAVVGGAATGAGVAADRRSLGTVVDDNVIRARINALWLDKSEEMLNRVELQVNEGRVLLTGKVPTPEMRLDAVRLAWQAEGVKEVINEIKVSADTSVGAYARDAWITAQLRSKLLFAEGLTTIGYSIETVDGVIYLMGIAADQAELERVTNIARNIEYVKRVVSYVRVAGAPQQGRS